MHNCFIYHWEGGQNIVRGGVKISLRYIDPGVKISYDILTPGSIYRGVKISSHTGTGVDEAGIMTIFGIQWNLFAGAQRTNIAHRTTVCAALPPDLTKAFSAQNGSDADMTLTKFSLHYNDVMMGSMASQITSLTIVYSAVYSGADQRQHQSSASLAFVWGIHRGPVNSPHKCPVMRKMFPFNIYHSRPCQAPVTAIAWV